MSRLSDRQRKILSYVHLNGDASYDEVARKCDTKSHVVRSEIRRLIAAKVIAPTLMINQTALGFDRTHVYFCIAPLSASERTKLIVFLKNHPYIYWLCEFVGSYDLGMAVMHFRVSALDEILNQVMTTFPGVFLRRQIASIVSWTYFGKKYLVSPNRFPRCIHMPSANKPVILDAIDRSILKILVKDCFSPQKEISRKINVPLSTINHRVRNLRERGVIAGHVYWISYSKMKVFAYRMLISFGGMTEELRKKISRFAEMHQNIVSLIFTLGSWDVEFGLDLEDSYSVNSIVADLRAFAPGQAFEVISLVRFDDSKWSTAPPGVFDN